MMRTRLLVWLPFLIGVLLIAVVMVDLAQFQRGAIEARAMLLREGPLLLVGLLFALGNVACSVYWAWGQQWALAAQAVASSLLFLVCIFIGGAMGAAYFNAT